jgi:peptide/nickel transport system substrate-binding protein
VHYWNLTIGLLVLSSCSSEVPESRTDGPAEQDRVSLQVPPSLDPEILKRRAFTESPNLTTLVEQSELPPVSDRLPVNPKVRVPFYDIGVYGGKIRRAMTGDIIQMPAVMKMKNEGLLEYAKPRADSVEANLAESITYQEDGKVAIVRLRRGIRWSDGHPFTADDVLFYYHDVLFDDQARPLERPIPPPQFVIDRLPIALEKVDDYTLRYASHAVMGRLHFALARTDQIVLPKHIFRKWHPRYNPSATYEDFQTRATRAQAMYSSGIPTLDAWMPVKWTRGQQLVFERNPYYWKVDSAGNQLPYLDGLVYNIIPDVQVILLKFLNGELDLLGRYTQHKMYQTLKASEGPHTYRVNQTISSPGGAQAFYLNWDTQNLPLRKAFRTKDVRIALSIALNREEISQLLFNGLLEPGGFSLYPPNPYATKESTLRYASYDPERAQRLLENAGYLDRDVDGIREFADGSPFELTFDIVSTWDTAIAEFVAEYWGAIGVKVHIYSALRDIIMPRRFSGEFEVHCWGLDTAAHPYQELQKWAITDDQSPWWHRNATREGPEWLHETTHHLTAAAVTLDENQIRHHTVQANDLLSENVPAIGIGATRGTWAASVKLGNIPHDMIVLEAFGGFGKPLTAEQIYFKESKSGSRK